MRRLARLLIVLAALVPPLVVALWVFSAAGDNPCSDEGIILTEYLTRLFEPGYHWRNLLRDTFFSGHLLLLPCLLIVADAAWRGLRMTDLLLLGMLLAGLRVFLLHRILTRGLEPSPWARAALWPALSALIFAPSLISTFEFTLLSLAVQLCCLGRELALFALVLLRGRWRGVLLIATGVLLACFSNGDGPVFAVVVLLATLLPPWRSGQRALVAAAVLVGLAPYAAMQPGSRPGPGLSPLTLALNTLGRLLARNTSLEYFRLPGAEVAAAIGIGLAACGLAIALRNRRGLSLQALIPSVVLMATSLAVCLTVGLFRRNVAPWYATHALGFWLGLLGLAWQLFWGGPAGSPSRRTARRWSALTMAAVGGLYAASNLTLEDKSFFQRLRSPAAGSCLRAYRTAPTYCQLALHVWPDAHPDYLQKMGRLLESHRFSVFRSQQRWALQGDVMLGNVRYQEDEGVPPVMWMRPGTAAPASFRDARALDLLVHAPNSVAWTVTLPRATRRADFCSAVAFAAGTPTRPPADGATTEVVVEPRRQRPYVAFSWRLVPGQTRWKPFCIPLGEQAGKSITLSLRSLPGPTSAFDHVVFRHPRIEIELGAETAPSDEPATAPSNTDLSPFSPGPGSADAVFAIDAAHWRVGGERSPGFVPAWAGVAGAYFEWTPRLDLALDDYSSLWVRGVPPDSSRMLRIQWEVMLPTGQRVDLEIPIPYLGDDRPHAYSYDLRLLELPRGCRLSAMRIRRAEGGKPWAGLEELRLLKPPLHEQVTELGDPAGPDALFPRHQPARVLPEAPAQPQVLEDDEPAPSLEQAPGQAHVRTDVPELGRARRAAGHQQLLAGLVQLPFGQRDVAEHQVGLVDDVAVVPMTPHRLGAT